MRNNIQKKRLAGVLCLFATFFMSLPRLWAADIALGNIFPGNGIIHKKIISIRERRYLNLVPQQTDFSCGAAALATILKYAYNKNITERSVLIDLFKISDPELVRRKGFSLLDVKRYVQSIGMRGRGYQLALNKLEQIKVPTIVLLDLKGYKHFVVLKKVVNNQVYIADPALGNKIYFLNDFAGMWNGVIFAVIGPGFDRHSILLNPDPPLTAKKLMPAYRTLTNAELLDFGFSNADLFAF